MEKSVHGQTSKAKVMQQISEFFNVPPANMFLDEARVNQTHKWISNAQFEIYLDFIQKKAQRKTARGGANAKQSHQRSAEVAEAFYQGLHNAN